MEKSKDGAQLADREWGLEQVTGVIPAHVSLNKISLKKQTVISGVASKTANTWLLHQVPRKKIEHGVLCYERA